jgi:hypothetical protein
MLIAACWLDERSGPSVAGKWLKTAGWVYIGVLIVGLLAIRYLPFRIGNSDEQKLGKGDITLDMSGWESFAVQFDSLYQSDINSGKMKAGSILISDYWFPAAHLDHYYAVPRHHNLLAFGPLNDIHHFAWLNQRRPRLNKGDDAYFIYPSNYYGPPNAGLKNAFSRVEDSVSLAQYRSENHVRNFVIYRMHEFRADSSAYLIPGIR